MAEHTAIIEWEAGSDGFTSGRYSREHTWEFDGGVTISASASPHVVPAPWSNPAGVDPEEAFVASIASCHMLTFLFLASREGVTVRRYRDRAVGTMARSETGQAWIARVTLHPDILFEGDQPPAGVLDRLHHSAHGQCFIASSVRTEIVVAAPE